jgi:hypothetical protein
MLQVDELSALRDLTAACACAGLAIASIEWLAPNRLASASLVYTENSDFPPARQRLIALGVRAVMVLRLAAACLAVAAALAILPPAAMGIGLAGVAFACLPLRISGPWGPYAGMNGAEHLLSAVAIALAPTYLFVTPAALAAALGFVAFRALAEYASAGAVKFGDLRAWASGRNLILVFSSSAWGCRWLANLLRRMPLVAGVASLTVIAIEIAVPASLLFPAPWTEHALVLALLFHLATGLFMGLNTFTLAFFATYPAVIWLRDLIQMALA